MPEPACTRPRRAHRRLSVSSMPATIFVTEVLAVEGPHGARRSGARRRELIHTLSDVHIHVLSLE